MAKIEIFECPGTNPTAPIYYPPADFTSLPFYNGVDLDVFNYTLIQGYLNAIYPLNQSVSAGVTALTSAINSHPGKFVLIGTSQGAQIVSRVFQQMTVSGGSLTSRLSDCLVIFLFGNPVRQVGTTFPGGTVISGHGIAPTANRLTNETSYSSLVWEFARSGDPVCTNGDDSVSLKRANIYDALQDRWSGIIGDIFNLGVGTLEEIAAIITMLTGMANFHNDYYSSSYRPISGDTRSAVQICLDYLNNVAGAAYRSDGWSTTLTA